MGSSGHTQPRVPSYLLPLLCNTEGWTLTCLAGVFVSRGYRNKLPQTEHLKTTQFYSRTALEAKSLILRCRQHSALWKGLHRITSIPASVRT